MTFFLLCAMFTSMKTPILETDRLILRPTSMDDAPAIQKYFDNWNVIKNLSVAIPWPYPADGAETFIRESILPQMKTGKAHFWVITIKEQSNEAVGGISFGIDREKCEDHGHRGFWLAEPFWGQGLMTEAITAVNGFVFDDLGIDKFYVMNVADNIASKRVKEKTGAKFVRYGELEHHSGTSKAEVWEVSKDD